MKVLLDIKDSKAEFVLELLHSLAFVKAKTITPAKAQLIDEIQEAVRNVNLVKAGKLKPRPARALLDEL